MANQPYPEEDFRVPEDPETEKVLLSTICQGPENPEVPQVLHLLNGGESFLVPKHRAIYLAAKSLYERQEEISSITLKMECESQGTINKVGGFSGIYETIDGTEVLHPLKLAQRLHDLWFRRQLQLRAAALLRQASDNLAPTEDLVRSIHELAGASRGTEELLSFPGIGALLDIPAPPPRWVIPGLIPYAVPCVVASKGGLGKSFLFLQACVSLAAGKPFLDFPAQPPMTVLYLSLEDSRETFQTRLQSIVSFWKEAADWSDQDDYNLRQNMDSPVIHWRSLGASGMIASMIPCLERYLEDQNAKGGVPGLVVIDTLARVSEGDENTVQALRPIVTACFRLADLGYSTAMLHHVGKGQDGAKGSKKDRPTLADRMNTEWVRGSSAIVDNFRAVIQMTAISPEEADGASLDADLARRGGLVVMGPTKTNGIRADWRLLEQDDHGRWFVPPRAIEALAKLRGSKAVATLTKQLALLRDIYETTRWGTQLDVAAMCEKHAPSTSKDKSAWLRSTLRFLRNSDLIEKKSYRLTTQGLQTVKDFTNQGGCNE